jgi:hypothetical protein
MLLLEILNFAALRTLLVSIPETLGLMVFGILLTATAVVLRKLLKGHDVAKADEKAIRKV